MRTFLPQNNFYFQSGSTKLCIFFTFLTKLINPIRKINRKCKNANLSNFLNSKYFNIKIVVFDFIFYYLFYIQIHYCIQLFYHFDIIITNFQLKTPKSPKSIIFISQSSKNSSFKCFIVLICMF